MCFATSPIMAVPESSVLPERECFQIPASIPISHPLPLQVPRFVTYGVITKKRTLRVRVDRIQELDIKISTIEIETEKKKKKKVVKKLHKPLPFDLNLLPDINEGEKVNRKRKENTNSKLQGTDKKTKNSSAVFSVPNPAPSLPNYLKAIIEGGGALEGDPILVLQRILNKTDLSFHHNRLGIPEGQVLCPGFLRVDEMRRLLNMDGIETDVIMPSLEKCQIILRRWLMGTNNSGIFVFSGNWNKCRETKKMRSKEHRILLNMVLQVWAYRYRGDDNNILFALVNVGWHPCNAAAEDKITATIAAADVAAAAAAAANATAGTESS